MIVYFINIILLISLGFFSADITNQFVGDFLDNPPKLHAYAGSSATLVAVGPREHLQKVLERNLFNSQPIVEAEKIPVDSGDKKPSGKENNGSDIIGAEQKAAVTLEEKKKAAVPTKLRVKLAGTIVGQHDTYIAIIEDPRKRKQLLYGLNDLIQEGVRIADIERNKVYIIRNGNMEVLETYGTKKGRKNAKRGTSARRRVAIQKPAAVDNGGELQMVVDKRELDDALSNIPQLLTKARIVPSFRNGKTEGFKIFSIVKGSLFDKVGLRNGDVLIRINEINIKDPQKFLSIFSQLKDESMLAVDLVRKGTRQTISYEIR